MKEVFLSSHLFRSINGAGANFPQRGDEKYSANLRTLNVADMRMT
jgi:hypothetical protein